MDEYLRSSRGRLFRVLFSMGQWANVKNMKCFS